MNENVLAKLKILTESAKYDVSCSSSGTVRRNQASTLGNTVGGIGICHSFAEDGRCISLLKIMLTNLEEQEKALTEMFSGFTERTEKSFTFYIEPEQEIKDQVVCRFSKKLGIVKEDNLAGEPVYL